MMGLNKEPYKRLEKNLLPSFEDEGWQEQGVTEGATRTGYEIGFIANDNSGYVYTLGNPNSLVGKVLSLSFGESEGESVKVTLCTTSNGISTERTISDKSDKIEGVNVPSDTTLIEVKLQSGNGTGYVYIKNVQLEIGERSTQFKERRYISRTRSNGLYLDGIWGGVTAPDQDSDLTSYDIEIDFTPSIRNTGAGSYWHIWNSNNQTGTYIAIRKSDRRLFISQRIDGVQRTWATSYAISSDIRQALRVTMSIGKCVVYINGIEVDRNTSIFVGKDIEINNNIQIGTFSTANTDRSGTLKAVIHRFRYNRFEYNFEEMDNLDSFIKYGKVRLINRMSRRIIDNKNSLRVKKKSFKKHSFIFERKSVNKFNRMLVGLNQPRISFSGGLLIEDGSSNCIINHGEDGITPYSRDGSGITISRTTEIEPLFGDAVYKWSKDSKVGTGNIYLNSSSYFEQRYSKEWTFSCYVKRSDGLPVTNIGSVYLYANSATGVRLNLNRPPSYIEECRDGWYRVVRQEYTSENSYISLMGLSTLDATTDWYFDGWQLESESYPTSFTTEVRASEIARIKNLRQYIDPLRGSIELNISPIGGFNIKSTGYGYQDLTCYSNGGFIIRRNRLNVGEVEFVVNTVSKGTLYKSLNLDLDNGNLMKYRIDWDANDNKTSLTVNDRDVEKLEHPMLRIPTGDLNIGHRGDMLSHDRGNAIYGNITIRDRWGRVVYKM